jgi:hypothetical protein
VLPAGNYRVEVAHRSVVAATNYHEEEGKLPLVIWCYILNPKSLVFDPNPSHYTLRRQVVVSRGNQSALSYKCHGTTASVSGPIYDISMLHGKMLNFTSTATIMQFLEVLMRMKKRG